MKALLILFGLLWLLGEWLLWRLFGPIIAIVIGLVVLIGGIWAWLDDEKVGD